MTASPIDTAQTCKPLADQQGAGELAINHVGVVGLGHMGHAFAVNLTEDGYQVMVYDRNPERTTALRASGASAAARLGDLAACDVVVTSLPDDEALAAVALGPSGLVGILSPAARERSSKQLAQIAQGVACCERCPLYIGATQAVVGEGPAPAATRRHQLI